VAATRRVTDRTMDAGGAALVAGGSDRLGLLERYFEACSGGTAEEIAACFTPGAVIFDTNLPPVHGDAACGRFWVKVRSRWGGATWNVDHALAAGDDAACEWTMRGAFEGQPVTFRGSDHYLFEGDRIAEVRQYWVFDRHARRSGLRDFPYPPPDAPSASSPTPPPS
jgi:hypothetical protein